MSFEPPEEFFSPKRKIWEPGDLHKHMLSIHTVYEKLFFAEWKTNKE